MGVYSFREKNLKHFFFSFFFFFFFFFYNLRMVLNLVSSDSLPCRVDSFVSPKHTLPGEKMVWEVRLPF